MVKITTIRKCKSRNKINNLTGRKFGKLYVIEKSASGPGFTIWRCRCDCGNECDLFTEDLLTGKHKSCGCTNF